MADIIGYSESGLNTLLQSLKDKKEAIDKVANDIKTSMDRVETAWEGRDSTVFTNKMRDDYVFLLDKYGISLDSYIKFINTAKEKYKEHDEKFAAKKISF